MLQRKELQDYNGDKLRASASALELLTTINLDDVESYIYPDYLKNITSVDTELGTYQVLVKRSCYDLTQCLKVKISTEVTLPEFKKTISIIAYIGDQLKTMFELFTQILKFPDHKIEQTRLIKKTDHGYEITTETTEKENIEHSTRFFSDSLMQGYISEGASVLLDRVLITGTLPMDFTVLKFTRKCELSTAVYKNLDSMKIPFDETKLELKGIEVVINPLTEFESTFHSFFLADGHLITRSQVGSPISMKIQTIPKTVVKDSYLIPPVFEETVLNWEDDLELISTFIDLKAEMKANYIKYMRNHPELRQLILDFFQNLMIVKPENTLKFAMKFFITFSTRANITSCMLKHPKD